MKELPGKGHRLRKILRFAQATDPEGLSIQVTPIGEFASVAVARIGLEETLVKASRHVEFFCTVNGVRKTKPISPGSEFMPGSADARMRLYLTDGQKALLVSNGTYNADGTVDMRTAERLGRTNMGRSRTEGDSHRSGQYGQEQRDVPGGKPKRARLGQTSPAFASRATGSHLANLSGYGIILSRCHYG